MYSIRKQKGMTAVGWVLEFMLIAIATLVVLTSFTLDGRKLRWVSSLGCSMWVIWGLMKEEPSVWVMNLIIILIHLYKLLSIERR